MSKTHSFASCNHDISASLHVIREGLGRFCV